MRTEARNYKLYLASDFGLPNPYTSETLQTLIFKPSNPEALYSSAQLLRLGV